MDNKKRKKFSFYKVTVYFINGSSSPYPYIGQDLATKAMVDFYFGLKNVSIVKMEEISNTEFDDLCERTL